MTTLNYKQTEVKRKNGTFKTINYLEYIPKGFKVLKGAMTAPLGFTWYTNGKSLFGGERVNVLVKDDCIYTISKKEWGATPSDYKSIINGVNSLMYVDPVTKATVLGFENQNFVIV